MMFNTYPPYYWIKNIQQRKTIETDFPAPHILWPEPCKADSCLPRSLVASDSWKSDESKCTVANLSKNACEPSIGIQ